MSTNTLLRSISRTKKEKYPLTINPKDQDSTLEMSGPPVTQVYPEKMQNDSGSKYVKVQKLNEKYDLYQHFLSCILSENGMQFNGAIRRV